MKKRRKLEQASNGYYNLGLSLAKERNLSSALNALSIAMGLNKKNIDARNLYGLIQFEMGEEAKALISWVISININPINNMAQNYLQKLRNRSSYLEKSQDAISKYNKAISQIRTMNYDMARITLKQAVDIRPHYVKAMLALSILDIREGRASEAKKLLESVISIDRFNAKAIAYLDELKPLKGKSVRKESKSCRKYEYEYACDRYLQKLFRIIYCNQCWYRSYNRSMCHGIFVYAYYESITK